jgi:hypothetical protein
MRESINRPKGRDRSVKFGIARKERVLKRQGINEGDGRKGCHAIGK